jgi:hypothetical protein
MFLSLFKCKVYKETQLKREGGVSWFCNTHFLKYLNVDKDQIIENTE